MPFFCLNKDPNMLGAYELHIEDGDCGNVPNEFSRVPLGHFEHEIDARKKAQRQYPGLEIESCFHCGTDKK